MKKFPILLIFLLIIPVIHAQEAEEDCGLSNLAVCIPQKLYDYTLNVLNSPLQPFLYLIRNLLSEPVSIDGFLSLWAIIIYIISLFYGLFIIFAGFNFIISGYSAEKREMAKEWLKNIVLMVLFVQASYLLYQLLVEISSSMTAAILNTIDPDFFLLTVDNLRSMGLQLILTIPYVVVLTLAILLLSLRYLLVAVGVLFFPIGLFLNFIPPLQSFGKLIINVLLISIFLPFVQALILLAGSKLVDIALFQNYKMIIMTVSFLLVNLVMLLLIAFAGMKAAFSAMRTDSYRAVRFLSSGAK